MQHPLSLSLTFSNTNTHTYPLSHPHTHTYVDTPIISHLQINLPNYTFTRTRRLLYTHTLISTRVFSLSLSQKCTHSQSFSVTLQLEMPNFGSNFGLKLVSCPPGIFSCKTKKLWTLHSINLWPCCRQQSVDINLLQIINPEENGIRLVLQFHSLTMCLA